MQILLPQTVLAVVASLMFLGGTYSFRKGTWGVVSLAALLGAGVALMSTGQVATLSAAGSLESAIRMDALAVGFQWATLVIAAIFVLTTMSSQYESETAAEFYALLLLMVSGLMLVGCANELVLLLLSLELISVPTYVLLYLGRRDHFSQEAATKYFLLSVLSSAILLYGFSFVYGLTGSTNLTAVRTVLEGTYRTGEPGLAAAGGSLLGLVALVLIFAGVGFKVAAVPFHFYAPDVYQGTWAFNAGLLAVVPKAAGFVALIRIANESLVGFEMAGGQMALILAAITMTGGNCLALLQTNVRRLLAYSSIAHAGYMLMGIAVGFWSAGGPPGSVGAGLGLPDGVQACLLYLLAYSLSSVGLFAVLVYLPRKGKQIEHLDDLTGLARSQPLMAISAALFLFSMAGIPPLPGFWGKLAVFASALSVRGTTEGALGPNQGFIVLAVVGVINAAIGAVYYVRMVAVMFLNDPLSTPEPQGNRSAYAAALCSAALVLLMGVAPRPVFQYLERVQIGAGPVTAQAESGAELPVVARE